MAAKNPNKQPLDFKDRVYKKLGKKPQSSTEVARKLKLVDANGKPTNYGRHKVRVALQALATERKDVIVEGQFRTTRYRLS